MNFFGLRNGNSFYILAFKNRQWHLKQKIKKTENGKVHNSTYKKSNTLRISTWFSRFTQNISNRERKNLEQLKSKIITTWSFFPNNQQWDEAADRLRESPDIASDRVHLTVGHKLFLSHHLCAKRDYGLRNGRIIQRQNTSSERSLPIIVEIDALE